HELAVATERDRNLVVTGSRSQLGDDVVPVHGLHRMLLESPDAVVAHDRSHVGIVTDKGVEVTERKPDGAVAEADDDLPVGVSTRRGERVPGPRPETAERARPEEAAGHERVDVLPGVRDEVSAVATHDGVSRQTLAHLRSEE